MFLLREPKHADFVQKNVIYEMHYLQDASAIYKTLIYHKPGPHDAMLHTCDGASKRGCDASKSSAMCCDRKLNMLNILVPI